MAKGTAGGSLRRRWARSRGPATLTVRVGFPRGRCSTADSIYKTPEGEAEIRTLYDEALVGLGLGYESLTVCTRLGDPHVLALGPEDAPPVVFLPGGNFLNPTCLVWFLPLARRRRLYAPDIVGQPSRSAQVRPPPKGDGHAFWVEDVLDGLGLREPVPLVGLSYGAGLAIRTMGLAPERVSRAALVSPAGLAAGPVSRMLVEAPPLCSSTASGPRRGACCAPPGPSSRSPKTPPSPPPSGSSGSSTGTSGWTPGSRGWRPRKSFGASGDR